MRGLDPLADFVAECQASSIIPEAYFCAKDLKFRADNPSWASQQTQYKDYKRTLILEVLNRYPGLRGVWIDADNTAFFASQGFPWGSCNEASTFITNNKQNLLAANNCQGTFTLSDGPIVVYEGGGFPGEFVANGNVAPSECCETIYTSGLGPWFYKAGFATIKDAAAAAALRNLANSRASNFLYNVPADTTGNIGVSLHPNYGGDWSH